MIEGGKGAYGSGRLRLVTLGRPGEASSATDGWTKGEEMANAERLKELMTTLDDAWNAQDLETFAQRHKPDTIVRWPGQPPTHGIEAHRQEAIDFFTAF